MLIAQKRALLQFGPTIGGHNPVSPGASHPFGKKILLPSLPIGEGEYEG